jgi:hypothetical protein
MYIETRRYVSFIQMYVLYYSREGRKEVVALSQRGKKYTRKKKLEE